MRKLQLSKGIRFIVSFENDYPVRYFRYYKRITISSIVRLCTVLDKMVNAGQMLIETDLVNGYTYYTESKESIPALQKEIERLKGLVYHYQDVLSERGLL